MEEASKAANKKKRGFMTPARKKKLRVCLLCLCYLENNVHHQNHEIVAEPDPNTGSGGAEEGAGTKGGGKKADPGGEDRDTKRPVQHERDGSDLRREGVLRPDPPAGGRKV